MAANVFGSVLLHFPATSSQDLTIALVLADASDHDGGNIYPSIPRVAALARCSDRTVQSHIQHFLKIGFLMLLRKGGGRGNPSKYRIDLGWLSSQKAVWSPFHKNGEPDSPISKTVQQPTEIGEETPKKWCRKGEERVQKGCRNGEAAASPDPIPPTHYPKTTTPPHELNDLLAALEDQARRTNKQNPRAWARVAVGRIKKEGRMAAEELELLESWRARQAMEKERGARLKSPPPQDDDALQKGQKLLSQMRVGR